jgi:succinyl-CoA synthetase alpha subunit
MGHAGAIVTGGKGTVEGKIAALTAAGALVAERPRFVGDLLQNVLHAGT